ncbi:hypothetical protein GLOIN_2v1788243 [Rhizophagus irregularis DAOM 181602=DAOM 197198]|uniref:Uncharacterized protein n=1 Tax=Rhizophagus irregularis (strain DAOM 181602 / DAOM 197198 / MUCL 43194) TaxID=747089 RepID=A0A2P4P465_RHIID|nr:hypothetical protein GLOIN_2v1788243 [Rhizophagus irregularis DAOM 181602=DAOM 197198]POG60175.1 hypothetical protein GLOIN_2v1788243 [Rhizophagus irregularis DAOM 181602=DAOM 197198]|eukprot:XP_025167041.1 hypothetical protein GLOIN_2v1788243 [Rhizophagus irregularis DAOM 181602=DAOM 197198]
MKATNLLKNKGILFLEQLLEANRMKLMKWKHICVENEYVKINKNEIITWNENYNTLGVFTKNLIEIEIEISYRIFNLNIKSQGANIGLHMIPNSINNSPNVRDVKEVLKSMKIVVVKECWIYIENKKSRAIKSRKEKLNDNMIKPYETYNSR